MLNIFIGHTIVKLNKITNKLNEVTAQIKSIFIYFNIYKITGPKLFK